VGPNLFSDLTQKEFLEGYLGLIVPLSVTPVLMAVTYTLKNIDWTTKGGVTPVRNQGACGSCWAFSALGAMESAYSIKGKTYDLSEQQLVDCSKNYGNKGCGGGWMSSAFQYILAKNITSEKAYPYVFQTKSCATTSGNYTIKSFK
jgi:C1A family cysteine protease